MTHVELMRYLYANMPEAFQVGVLSEAGGWQMYIMTCHRGEIPSRIRGWVGQSKSWAWHNAAMQLGTVETFVDEDRVRADAVSIRRRDA